MNTLLWIVAALLATAFGAAGVMKVAQSKEKLAGSPNMAWSGDFAPRTIKLIGALEVLAAIGLILPAAVDLAPDVVPVAAVGLALVMVGAAAVHLRRHEPQAVVVNAVLLALATVVAWGRFGPHSF